VTPELNGPLLLTRPVDNSRVVREVDPRSHRELWTLVALAALLVGGLVLYAWPHLALRQTGMAGAQLARERDRLEEENRKLRLEKAALEDLGRIEVLATRQLGLQTPPPERVTVVDPPPTVARRVGRAESARNEAVAL
jgi:cell division protein FtsL